MFVRFEILAPGLAIKLDHDFQRKWALSHNQSFIPAQVIAISVTIT